VAAVSEYEVSTTFFAVLTVLANVATLGLWASFAVVRGERRDDLRQLLRDVGLPLAAMVAVVATAGSLYLSERLQLVPCTLCWYQRIGMYPLAAILVVAAIRRDWGVKPYALVLALGGPVISVYHYLEERFPHLDVGACSLAIPCSQTLIWRYHYISIPFMALSGFALIATLLIGARS
jgi:disulfide bond formation protein DsbB